MRTPIFDPWQVLRSMPHIRLVYHDQLRDDWLGASSPRHKTIWINARRVRSQTERRCTLTHELVHLGHHHEGHQPAAVERRVREETAHLLVPRSDLLSALAWTTDLYELADTLWVTPAVMRDRIHLHQQETHPCA